MNNVIKRVMKNSLKAEADLILRSDEELETKVQKFDDIQHLLKILDYYEELEPIIKEFFEEKAKKEKWEHEKE